MFAVCDSPDDIQVKPCVVPIMFTEDTVRSRETHCKSGEFRSVAVTPTIFSDQSPFIKG